MKWFGSINEKKCVTCSNDIVIEAQHELRLETLDGIVDIEICEECARFWDMSANVLLKNKQTTDSES